MSILSGYTISYAQNREDVILESFFTNLEKGFYVDIGANDPNTDSVTKHFYDKGWSGINVEPIKKIHKVLAEERPRDININVGISDRCGSLKLREYIGLEGHSTFSENTKKHKDTEQEYVEYDVEVVTLEKLFKDNKVKQIDFLKIDVEGLEDEVVTGNDWSRYRPTVVCIEADHRHRNWIDKFLDWNYVLVMHDGLNEYYLAKESESLLVGFSERLVLTAHNSLKAHQYNSLDSVITKLEEKNEECKIQVKGLNEVVNIQRQALRRTSYTDRGYASRIKLAIYSLTLGWLNRHNNKS